MASSQNIKFGTNRVAVRAPDTKLPRFCTEFRSGSNGTSPGPQNPQNKKTEKKKKTILSCVSDPGLWRPIVSCYSMSSMCNQRSHLRKGMQQMPNIIDERTVMKYDTSEAVHVRTCSSWATAPLYTSLRANKKDFERARYSFS